MEDITVEELKTKLDAHEDVILIDVRENYEHEEFNIGGQLIPLGTLPSSIPGLLDHKDKEIVVYCRSGARSGAAKITLSGMGFTKVRNMLGGVLEWKRSFPQNT
jgi:rhodanese-related sulfurtransferase